MGMTAGGGEVGCEALREARGGGPATTRDRVPLPQVGRGWGRGSALAGEVDGCWYVIGHDLDREAMRTFALPRITRLKVTPRSFKRPTEFDGTSYLHDSFGVWPESRTLTQK